MVEAYNFDFSTVMSNKSSKGTLKRFSKLDTYGLKVIARCEDVNNNQLEFVSSRYVINRKKCFSLINTEFSKDHLKLLSTFLDGFKPNEYKSIVLCIRVSDTRNERRFTERSVSLVSNTNLESTQLNLAL